MMSPPRLSVNDDVQADARASRSGVEIMTRSSVYTLGMLETPSINQTGARMWRLGDLRVSSSKSNEIE